MSNKPPYLHKVLAILLILNLVGITMFISSKKLQMILSRKKIVKNKNHLILDERSELNKTILYQHISKSIPYLPIEDLNNMDYINRNLNRKCAWYPSFVDVKIHNDYWQEFQNEEISYYIFGAYLDNRPTVVKKNPVVRILTMIHFISPKVVDYPITYCQFWYEEQSKPIIMPANNIRRIWYYQWGHSSKENYGHFVTCSLPNKHKNWIPRTVSLVSRPCDKATNNVRVTYIPLKEGEVKKGFAVCHKGLDYPYVDISHRLVEYMETMRSLGAEKIIMYNLQVHPNNTKVLKYYEKTGFLEYRPFSSSLEVGNLPDFRHMAIHENYGPYMKHEVIPYNDCFYRNMYHYKYIAVSDVDEIHMPLGKFNNWHDLMEFGETVTTTRCKGFASFCFRCIYFPRYAEKPKYTNEFPEYFYMLQHVERVRDHIRPDWATKCLHDTDHVIATHNHMPVHFTKNVCRNYSFAATEAQLHHYREPDIKETLNDSVVDKSLWRFKDEIIERSTTVFEELDFF